MFANVSKDVIILGFICMQGLSKEGGNITKNLLLEITVLTIGFLIGCVADTTIQVERPKFFDE